MKYTSIALATLLLTVSTASMAKKTPVPNPTTGVHYGCTNCGDSPGSQPYEIMFKDQTKIEAKATQCNGGNLLTQNFDPIGPKQILISIKDAASIKNTTCNSLNKALAILQLEAMANKPNNPKKYVKKNKADTLDDWHVIEKNGCAITWAKTENPTDDCTRKVILKVGDKEYKTDNGTKPININPLLPTTKPKIPGATLRAD